MSECSTPPHARTFPIRSGQQCAKAPAEPVLFTSSIQTATPVNPSRCTGRPVGDREQRWAECEQEPDHRLGAQ
jgi:hypothetical protein